MSIRKSTSNQIQYKTDTKPSFFQSFFNHPRFLKKPIPFCNPEMERIISEYKDLEEIYQEDPRNPLPEEKEEVEEKDPSEHLTYHSLGPAEIKLLTGFEPDEFDELVELLSVPLTPPAIGRRGRRPTLLATAQDRLLILLTWFRFFDPWARLATVFGVSRTHAHTVVLQILDSVAPVLKELFVRKVSHREQAEAKALFLTFPEVTAVTDSTFQRTTKPMGSYDEAKKYFYVKAKMYGLKSLTIHACNGELLAAYPGYPAATSDVTLFRKPEVLTAVRGIVSKDPEEAAIPDPNPEWAVMADLGFQGIQHNVRAVLPIKKRPRSELLSAEKAYNTRLAKRRIIIENFYARLKRKFRIMSVIFNLDKDLYPNIFYSCACLVNFDISRRPLRANRQE